MYCMLCTHVAVFAVVYLVVLSREGVSAAVRNGQSYIITLYNPDPIIRSKMSIIACKGL